MQRRRERRGCIGASLFRRITHGFERIRWRTRSNMDGVDTICVAMIKHNLQAILRMMGTHSLVTGRARLNAGPECLRYDERDVDMRRFRLKSAESVSGLCVVLRRPMLRASLVRHKFIHALQARCPHTVCRQSKSNLAEMSSKLLQAVPTPTKYTDRAQFFRFG